MYQGFPRNGGNTSSLVGADQPRPNLEGLHFTLYIFPFSLYSIMVRFTISLGSHYQEGAQGLPRITHKLVNLHQDENLEEWYLTTVNPEGQVPVMFAQRDGQPDIAKTPGSLDISKFLCMAYFPGMTPDEHRATIEDSLDKIHAIVDLSLTIKDPGEDDKVEIRNQKLEELLARNDISASYRPALEYKQAYYKQTLAYALRPENVAKAKCQADELFEQLLVIYEEHNGPSSDKIVQWLFGPSIGPTILDAHATAFIARLDDAGQEDMVPPTLLSYTRGKVVLPASNAVCHDRKTLWRPDYGHVHMLVDI
ncbi:hypothetical protein VMCG_08745 [Cytospora schulzeri]|uniref:Uncharacterized protein n=1 Tax=Cytospora schulzeri TaxID=448051 RepID=A0A423VQ61_9PEZI|nr:hypothetical protein VMCG_08745 [Valsa malicola]